MADPNPRSSGKWSLFGGTLGSTATCWQDRDIRFDVSPAQLVPRPGEFLIDTLSEVEDTKGNNGEVGQLHITNLRLVWVAQHTRRMNLTVGYSTIVSINIRQAASRLRGKTQALYLLTKHAAVRFEFIFTHVVRDSPRLFTTIQAVFRAYDTTRLYRDLKLRGALISGKELRLLEQEQLVSKVNGVWNLSSEQGTLGTFFVSNVRVVWHANLAETFNVSIPYLQMISVGVRDSKFGRALVIETQPPAGGYILGFKVEPPERMQAVQEEIASLWKAYSQHPVFGVEWTSESSSPPLEALTIAPGQEDIEVMDAPHKDHWAAYCADGAPADRKVVFNAELGLAMEALPEGVTLQQLWDVT